MNINVSINANNDSWNGSPTHSQASMIEPMLLLSVDRLFNKLFNAYEASNLCLNSEHWSQVQKVEGDKAFITF